MNARVVEYSKRPVCRSKMNTQSLTDNVRVDNSSPCNSFRSIYFILISSSIISIVYDIPSTMRYRCH